MDDLKIGLHNSDLIKEEIVRFWETNDYFLLKYFAVSLKLVDFIIIL